MKTRSWISCGLVLALTFATTVEAAPKGKATVKNVGGVNEYTYTGPKKKKKVVKEEAPAPSLTLADGQAAPAPAAPTEPMSARPTTNPYGPAATPPVQGTYTQTHVPANPAAAHQGTYTQTHSPGPNSGKAANGFTVPGGAQILTTGPIFYPFPYAGGGWGGGWGAGPIQLAPGGYGYDNYYNQGYNGYNGRGRRGNCNQPVNNGCDQPVDNGCSSPYTGASYQGSYTGPWEPPAYNPPAYNPTGR